ncbi:MAG: helix-turn-helix domain-containing protein [Pseudomonadota bacterium]
MRAVLPILENQYIKKPTIQLGAKVTRDVTHQLLLSRQFASFEELAEMVVAWDLDFRQLSKNYSTTTADQILAGNILYSHLSSGCFATHAGETPEGMCTISLPDAGCPEFRFNDERIDRPVLIVSLPEQEFELVQRPGYGISNFSIPYAIFDEYCENNFGCPAEKMLKSRERVIFIDPDMAANLRSLQRNLSALARLPSDLPHPHNPIQSFESQLLENFFDPLHQEKAISKEPKAASKTRILKRAMEFMRDHEHEPFSVRDLSAVVTTSERTLQRLFNREFGISPKKYLFGHRMYGAHRQLWQSSPSETRIIDAANAWGFWHMGQFAKDYRSFFGELPSETLNRPGTTRYI